MLSEFILYIKVRLILVGIDGTGFGYGQSSYYYTKRARLRRKFVKVSIAADMNHQIVCAIKIRHQPRHDNIDFVPLLEKTNQIISVNTVVADKGYDSENNHVAAKDLGIASVIIPPRYADVPVRKIKGHYRKALKRDGYDRTTYYQRNKVETIFSVIKRMFGDSVTSRNVATINHEMIYRVIAYNCHRIMRNDLLVVAWFLHGLMIQQFIFYANLQHCIKNLYGRVIIHTSNSDQYVLD
jgi:transposase